MESSAQKKSKGTERQVALEGDMLGHFDILLQLEEIGKETKALAYQP
jgi:hypothetical protein